MKWIDAHQHFWNYQPERDTWIGPDMARIQADFYPAQAQERFQALGIDACVAVQADPSEEETLFLLALAEQEDFIQGVVGWVDLQDPDLATRLDYFSQFEKLKGFRHLIQGEKDPAFMQRAAFVKGIKALAAFDFRYDLLIYAHQMPACLQLAAQCDAQALVLDHMGKPDIAQDGWKTWKKDLSGFKSMEHVMAKLSGLITEAKWNQWKTEDIHPYLEVALEVFGPKRLMFGSDYPVVLVAGELASWLDCFQSFIEKLSPTEQAHIKAINAQSFYQLDVS